MQLWMAFLLVCVLSGFGLAVYQLFRIHQERQIDDELELRVSALNTALRKALGPGAGPGQGSRPFDGPPGDQPRGDRPSPPPDSPRAGPDEFRPGPDRKFGPGPGEGRGDRLFERSRDTKLPADLAALVPDDTGKGFYYAVWLSDRTFLKASTNAPVNLQSQMPPLELGGRTRQRTIEGHRQAYRFTGVRDCVLVGRSIAPDLKERNRFQLFLWLAGGGILALGLGGNRWIVSRAIRPIAAIGAAANRISEGNLSERISVPDADVELGQLAEVLNSTFARLETAFKTERQKQQELAKALDELNRSNQEIRQLQEQLQVVCAWTKRIKVEGAWIPLDQFLANKLRMKISHGISPEAAEQLDNSLDGLLDDPRP